MMVISAHSHKGGAGKTTLALMLAKAHALGDRRVCAVDLDFQGSGFELMVAVPRPDAYLDEFITRTDDSGRPALDAMRVRHQEERGGCSFDLLLNRGGAVPDDPRRSHARAVAMSGREPTQTVLRQGIASLLDRLRESRYDVVLLDCHPGLVYLSGSVLDLAGDAAADEHVTIFVATANRAHFVGLLSQLVDLASERDRRRFVPARSILCVNRATEQIGASWAELTRRTLRREGRFEPEIDAWVSTLDMLYAKAGGPNYLRILESKEILALVAPRAYHEPALDILLQYEWLAHAQLKPVYGGELPKLYRDHVLHPASVCAIGWWMLGDGGPPPLQLDTVASLLEEQHSGKLSTGVDWSDVTKRAWVLASLSHDLFYPVEFLRRLSRRGEELNPRLWTQHVRRKVIQELLNSASIGVFREATSHHALCNAVRAGTHSHAAAGALNLLEADSGYVDAPPRRQLIHELAAVAILLHHSKKTHQLDYEKQPLAFLLALADECHEFGREMVVWEPDADGRRARFIPPVRLAKFATHDAEFRVLLDLQEPTEMALLVDAGFALAELRKGKQEGFDRLNAVDDQLRPTKDYLFGVELL
jgi:cellulose biosynthesis protein BcsQ